MDARVGDDWGLLRRYADARDERAFAELVRRYVDLVYSAAARRVGDRHLAEDVTQAVFVILAQKASSLARQGYGPLSAWLLTTVRYCASNAIRIERRRIKHEREAAGLPLQRKVPGAAGAASSNPSDVILYHELASHLDDAVLKLPDQDRRAILLRYFDNRPIADVAADLRITEAAAKQRLSRAVDKLRKRLAVGAAAYGIFARGNSEGFASFLSDHAVHSAPPGLAHAATVAATATAATAAGVAGTAAGITIAKGALAMMTWTKVKTLAAAIAVASIVGTGAVVTVNRAGAAERSSAGARPVASRAPAATKPADTGAAKQGEQKFKLKDNNGIIGVETAPPVVVKTIPESGAADVDASGVTELRVTFSKEMEPGNFSFARFGKDTFPQTTGKAHFEADKKTCVMPVKLEPGHPYVIWLNKPPYDSFMDAEGHKAVQYLLVFETKP